MKRSKQVCHSGKWKVSGYAYLMEQGGEAMARVLSVNVGRVREFDYSGRPAKRPFGNRRLPVVSRPEG